MIKCLSVTHHPIIYVSVLPFTPQGPQVVLHTHSVEIWPDVRALNMRGGKSNPRNVFFVEAKWQLLLKDNISYSGTGRQGFVIMGWTAEVLPMMQ